MKDDEFKCRRVIPLTTEEGQRNYYAHMNLRCLCLHNDNPQIVPTIEDAEKYLQLKAEESNLLVRDDIVKRRKYRQLQIYKTDYDWRPQKSSDKGRVGLVSPTGEQLLPNSFADVFTQFDAINNKPEFIPVSNGEAWSLVSLSTPPILITDFKYNAIIPERWERRLFFVQDKESKKWGALKIEYPFLYITLNKKPYKSGLPLVKTLMPSIADEIYEDELMTEGSPTTFFVTLSGNKIGILTDFGYSDIIYDSYEVDDKECLFRLIRNDRKRARRAYYWQLERDC